MGRISVKASIKRVAKQNHIDKFGMNCYYCGIELWKTGYHLDHVIPYSEDNCHDIDNLVLTCPFCNRAKWDYEAEDFLGYLAHIRSNDFKCNALEEIGENTRNLEDIEIDRLR